MKRLLVIWAVTALSIAQTPRVEDGRYYPSDDGQYRADNSGAYNGNDGTYRSDNSGAYVPDGSGSYRGGFEKYIHTPDQFGGSGGGGGGNGGAGGTFIGSGRRGPITAVIIGVQPVKSPGAKIASVVGTGSTGAYRGVVSARQGSAAGLYDNRNYAIIRKEEQVGEDGYHYLYETENKILGEEQGRLANVGTDKEAMQANGYFEYTGPDNVVYRVDYTANENGFVPSAAHIPTPPPIPEAILRSLEYQRSIGEL